MSPARGGSADGPGSRTRPGSSIVAQDDESDLREYANVLLDRARAAGDAAARADPADGDCTTGEPGSGESVDAGGKEAADRAPTPIENPFAQYRIQQEQELEQAASQGGASASQSPARVVPSSLTGAGKGSGQKSTPRRTNPLVMMPSFFLTGWGLGGDETAAGHAGPVV